MESNKLPLENNISQKENNLIYNTLAPDNYHNIETTESSNIPPNNIPNKVSLSSILSNLIKKTNSTPLNLKNLFNKWKNITFFKERHLLKKSRKILIKKTFNIRRPKGNEELLDNERKKIKILKKFKPINLNEDSEKRKKIINFIEERIMAYISKKDILRKYYDIWLSKVNNKEIISNRKITKKTIIKFKDNKKDKKVNILNEKEEKIKNIINYKESINKYFNRWKTITNSKENEINENASPIKIIKKEYPSKRLKIVKKIITKNPKKLKEKRKKKLTKIIVSKNTIKQDSTEFLRKYFNKWISIVNNEDDGNLIQEDKPIKMIIEKEDNNININKIENLKETKDSEIYNNKKEITNSNEKKNKEKKIINKVIIKKNIIKGAKKSKIQNNDENKQPKELKDNINIEENIEYIINSPIKEEKIKEIKPKEQNDNDLISKVMIPQISKDELLHVESSKKEENNVKELPNLDSSNEKNKLEKLIKIGNPIKNYFNKWKIYSQLKQKQKENEETIINVVTEKIVTKKKVLSIKNKLEQKEKEESPIHIIKKEKEQPLINTDSDKKTKIKAELKIIEVIKKRIASYLSTKQLLRKYYNIWLSKVPPDIIKESVVNKIINKKVLSFKKGNKSIVNDKSAINQVKKNLFSSDQENEIEKNIKLQIFKKNDNEKLNDNLDLFEDINIDKIQDNEMSPEKSENDIFKNNIMRLSQKFKNNIEKEDNNNNILTDQKEEIILNNNEKQLDNEIELNNIDYSEKDRKLKYVVKNKKQLVFYFKQWIKIIYLNKNKKNQTEAVSEIKDDDKNNKIEESKYLFLETLETLDNIYIKILKKKFFIFLKTNKGKYEIENETNYDLNKKKISAINEDNKNIESINVDKNKLTNIKEIKEQEISNETNEQKVKYNKNKFLKNKEESDESNKPKIVKAQIIKIGEKNFIDNQINQNIENEQYKNNPNVDIKNIKIPDNSKEKIKILEIKTTEESKNEKDNEDLKIPINDNNNNSIKVKGIENEKEIINQEIINYQETNEPEKEEIKIEEIKKDKEKNNKLDSIKNIELENKNDEEPKIVEEKILIITEAKDEIKNKNLNEKKDIDIEDSDKQIKSQEIIENDENIIINKEDNNKKEQSEEEIKEDLKLDNKLKNISNIEGQNNNQLNIEKFEQNIEIKENYINEELSMKENDNISNNHKGINNNKKYKFAKKLKVSKIKKENSDEYIGKEVKEKPDDLKQSNSDDNFGTPETENNIEKIKGEMKNINLNEDILIESNEKKLKDDNNNKLIKEKEESEESNKLKIIQNKKIKIDENKNIENEKIKNNPNVDIEKEKITDNSIKDINVLEEKTNESKNEDDENLKIPLNDNNNNNLINIKTLENESEKELNKGKVEEIKIENEINKENMNNFDNKRKENDNIKLIKNIELDNKNNEKSKNIGEKILIIPKEKNENEYLNENKDIKDSEIQIKTQEIMKSDENIIINEIEDNNKKEKYQEEKNEE